MVKNIWVNEDNSYFYLSRYQKGRDITIEDVRQFVEQFTCTGVSTVLFTPNSMTTSYRSKVWDHAWHDYDGSDSIEHPLFRTMTPEDAGHILKWVHSAWQLDRDGIDPYEIWMEWSRRRGISPWISMRMNDVHWVDNEDHAIHSNFWRKHPQLRQVKPALLDDEEKKRCALSWTDKSFDYGEPAVRDYHFALIEELAQRYDFDGLEMDWMRFGVLFPPANAWKGRKILTEFIRRVRVLLDAREKARGHRIRLGVRVPSRPDSAMSLGLDAPAWVREGLVDHVVVTPFFASIDNDIPIELWKELFGSARVELAAGMEMCVKASPQANVHYNTSETVRGSAISALERGADHIYLFNYFDRMTEVFKDRFYFMPDGEYAEVMRDLASVEAMQGKKRRHIVTFADTYGPGQPACQSLPKALKKDECGRFRIHIGPLPQNQKAQAVIGVEGCGEDLLVRINGRRCAPLGGAYTGSPIPDGNVHMYSTPVNALQEEYNIIEVYAGGDCTIVWVELAIA